MHRSTVRVIAITLASAALTGCPRHFHQPGANSQFLSASAFGEDTAGMRKSYEKVPADFTKRLIEAGASCAKTSQGAAARQTVCAYVYCSSFATIMVWRISELGITSSHDGYYKVGDDRNKVVYDCGDRGAEFRTYQREFVQRGGAISIDEA